MWSQGVGWIDPRTCRRSRTPVERRTPTRSHRSGRRDRLLARNGPRSARAPGRADRAWPPRAPRAAARCPGGSPLAKYGGRRTTCRIGASSAAPPCSWRFIATLSTLIVSALTSVRPAANHRDRALMTQSHCCCAAPSTGASRSCARSIALATTRCRTVGAAACRNPARSARRRLVACSLASSLDEDTQSRLRPGVSSNGQIVETEVEALAPVCPAAGRRACRRSDRRAHAGSAAAASRSAGRNERMPENVIELKRCGHPPLMLSQDLSRFSVSPQRRGCA